MHRLKKRIDAAHAEIAEQNSLVQDTCAELVQNTDGHKSSPTYPSSNPGLTLDYGQKIPWQVFQQSQDREECTSEVQWAFE